MCVRACARVRVCACTCVSVCVCVNVVTVKVVIKHWDSDFPRESMVLKTSGAITFKSFEITVS